MDPSQSKSNSINYVIFYFLYSLLLGYLLSNNPDYYGGLVPLFTIPFVFIILSQPKRIVLGSAVVFALSVGFSILVLVRYQPQIMLIPTLIILSNLIIVAILYFWKNLNPNRQTKNNGINKEDSVYRESIVEVMSDSVQWLLKSPDWQESVPEVLSKLGKLIQVSRIYIFENFLEPNKGLRMSWKYEWAAPGVSPKISKIDTHDYSLREMGLQNWETLLSQNHLVHGFVRLLPEKSRTIYSEIGLKSFLLIPVFVNNQWWGGIGLDDYNQERNWDTAEKDALRLAANLLGSVIERLESEQLVRDLLSNERHQRELFQALSEIGALLVSTYELEPLLDILLEQMRRVIEYDSASVMLRIGNKVKISRLHGYYKDIRQNVKLNEGFEFRLDETRNLKEMFELKKPLIIPDTRAYDWVFIDGIEYIRSFAGAPILVQGEVVAFLTLDKAEPNFYKEEHVGLLTVFSNFVGIAIQNARYLESATKKVEEAETLRKASSLVASELELEQVLKEILVQLEKVMAYDSASIFLATQDGLKVMAGRYLPNNNAIVGHTLPIEDKLFEEISESKTALILEDAQQDPRFLGFGNTGYIRGWMGLPMYLRGQIIGYLSLDNRNVGAYTIESANLIQSFANEAAIAIENARLFRQVQTLAITDPLTSVFNRRYFFEIGAREFRRSIRHNHPLSLLLIDIDHFKMFNDRYGHLAGDEVLKRIGKECQKFLRETDIFARFGGEEFVLLLPETTAKDATIIAERVLKIISDIRIEVAGELVSVSVSIGVSERELDTSDINELFEYADKALYKAKQQGRGKVMMWEPRNPINS